MFRFICIFLMPLLLYGCAFPFQRTLRDCPPEKLVSTGDTFSCADRNKEPRLGQTL